MSFFNGVTSASQTDESQALEKALTAGYGTDSATFINGRALIPEDMEATTMNVVAALKEDCKVFNSLKTAPCRSTVHEFNRRKGFGNFRHLSVSEGGSSPETNQSIERAFAEMKYLQTRRSVTKQMETVDTFENALASEKIAGVETIIMGAEHQIFHGNSAVVPTEFDGLLAQLDKSGSNAFIKDYRGNSIGASGYGDAVFDEVADEIYRKGGEVNRALFPSVLARDIKDMYKDMVRLTTGDTKSIFPGIPDYETAIGATLRFSGAGAGADKFFRVKGVVEAEGDANLRPGAPASVTASAASATGSKFGTGDAGNYKYTVHAVNAYGISAGTALASPIAVAANDGVTLTITPNADGKATGFIICRSKAGGNDVMEMCQIAKGTGATTSFVDKNEDLPGTASMIFLPADKIQSSLSFGQLLPVSTIPLYPTATAETPFLVVLYGALVNRAPEWMALSKNISYHGGLY